MGVDRYRVCELYAAGPDGEGSGSGYRLGDRLVLTARHVIAPALAGPGGQVLVRPVGVAGWLPARVEWEDADADAALVVIEDEGWRAPAGESVLRWGELAGSDPVPCAAVGFPWASVRPDRMRDTAHVYGQLAPLGQLKAGPAGPGRGVGVAVGPGGRLAVGGDVRRRGDRGQPSGRGDHRRSGPLPGPAGRGPGQPAAGRRGFPGPARRPWGAGRGGAGRGGLVSAAARRAGGQPGPGLPAGQPPVPPGAAHAAAPGARAGAVPGPPGCCWIRSPAGARARPAGRCCW